jgi:hypothetical protein
MCVCLFARICEREDVCCVCMHVCVCVCTYIDAYMHIKTTCSMCLAVYVYGNRGTCILAGSPNRNLVYSLFFARSSLSVFSSEVGERQIHARAGLGKAGFGTHQIRDFACQSQPGSRVNYNNHITEPLLVGACTCICMLVCVCVCVCVCLCTCCVCVCGYLPLFSCSEC